MSQPEQEITLTIERGGERVDRVLTGALADVTRGDVQRWIGEGRVTVNGRPVKASHRVAAHDVVVLWRPPAVEPVVLAEPIPLSIVYEDADLLVVDKPAGMVVHPAPGHRQGTLVNALLAWDSRLAEVGGAERAGIVHRLDRDTSGLMVVARTLAAHEALQRQFKTRRVQKTYVALVEGLVETLEGRIEAPIARDPAMRKRMAVVPAQRGGRAAASTFGVLGHYLAKASAQRLEYTLLELQLLTGRTHQIRVHLAHLGFPILGDDKYGDFPLNKALARQGLKRMFLHARRLVIRHPLSRDKIVLEAPLPAELLQFIESSKRHAPAV
jgi:23S rRNA pseudouridine1911/1915/1917 synthase